MAFSQGSRAQLAYVPEVTFGLTPAVPAMLELPFVRHSLDLDISRVESQTIIADRMPRHDRHGNRHVLGDIEVELTNTDHDDLYESVFFNTFATNVLKVGTTFKHLSMEDGALDITQFTIFTGCTAGELNVTARPNEPPTGRFSMVGAGSTISATPLDAAITAATGGAPFDSYSGAIQEGGGAIATLTGIDFTIRNSLAPTFVLGSQVTPQLEYGRAEVFGTLTSYFEDATLIDKVLAETTTSVSLQLDDSVAGKDYTFLIPAVKLNGAPKPVDGPLSRLVNFPFVGIYDVVTGTNLQLTRTII